MFKVSSHVPLLSSGLAALALISAQPAAAAGGDLDTFIKSFQDNPNYVQPFATLFGSMTNSGWYQSAGVARGFGFYFGMPINLTYLADADRSFSGSFVDQGCRLYHQNNPGGNQQCAEVVNYQAPTFFGRVAADTLRGHDYDPGAKVLLAGRDSLLSDGMAGAAAFNWFPFFEPQLSFNFRYTEIKLRYLAMPVSPVQFNMPGVGIQHDFASFLPPLPLPFSFSAAANFTWLNAEFKPGHGIDGTLKLNGFSHFLGLLVGYNLHGWTEAFVEAGWEGSSLQSGGTLVIKGKNGDADETVRPNLDLEGRNGFRAALSVALHLGYEAVLGQNFGAELGHNVNILGYRYK